MKLAFKITLTKPDSLGNVNVQIATVWVVAVANSRYFPYSISNWNVGQIIIVLQLVIGVRQNAIIGLEKCTVHKAIKKSIIKMAKIFKLFSLKSVKNVKGYNRDEKK